MAKRPGQKITMTSIDELLCVPDTEGTIDIDVEAIYPFENHPFKVIDDERMEELTESIRASGVLTPVLVRPDDEGTYEMISGHRRLRAAKRVGLRKIPAIIKEMTDDEATIAMVDGNIQREEILPSEKAFAFKMKLQFLHVCSYILFVKFFTYILLGYPFPPFLFRINPISCNSFRHSPAFLLDIFISS